MASKPKLDIFTGSENLGAIFLEQVSFNVKFSEFNIPLTNATGNTAVDWKGKVRTIMVQGAMSGDGFSGSTQNDKIYAFINTLESKIDIGGFQSVSYYTDSFGAQYGVKIFDFTWKRAFNDPNRIIYTLMMKQVS